MTSSPEHESTSTQDDFNLSPDTVIKFIHRVKSMPVLYNQDHEHFRNVAIKQKAWAEISKEFGKSEKWCLKKWISLRDYFVKRKKRLRSNFGTTFRPWIYYDELSFLNVIYGHDQLDYYPPNATDSGHHQEDASSGYFFYQKEEDSFEPEVIDVAAGEHVEEDNVAYLDQKLDINHDQAQNSDDDDNDDDDENYNFIQPQVEISQEIEDDDDDVMQPNTRRSSNRIHLHGSTTIELRPAASHQHRRHAPPNHKSAERAIVMPRLSSSLTTRSPPQQQLEDAPPISSLTTAQKRIHPDPSSSRPYLIPTKRNKKVHPPQQQVIDIEDDDNDQEEDDNGIITPPIGNGHSSSVHHLSSIPHMTDPYDLFCLSIAAQLKKMPRDKAILMQIEIMNLLYQSEFSENTENNTANK